MAVDVMRAFDGIDIDLMLAIVEPLLQHAEYLVMKYAEVGPRALWLGCNIEPLLQHAEYYVTKYAVARLHVHLGHTHCVGCSNVLL